MPQVSWWNEERDNALRELWKTETSAREIAKEMGATSRNSVIGRAHRLGLSGQRPKVPHLMRGSNMPKPPTDPTEIPEVIPEIYEPAPKKKYPVPKLRVVDGNGDGRSYKRNVTLMERRWGDQCAFPTNSGGPFRFCGAKVIRGLHYCPECLKKMYQPGKAPVSRPGLRHI
jgi:hypothetical protein